MAAREPLEFDHAAVIERELSLLGGHEVSEAGGHQDLVALGPGGDAGGENHVLAEEVVTVTNHLANV